MLLNKTFSCMFWWISTVVGVNCFTTERELFVWNYFWMHNFENGLLFQKLLVCTHCWTIQVRFQFIQKLEHRGGGTHAMQSSRGNNSGMNQACSAFLAEHTPLFDFHKQKLGWYHHNHAAMRMPVAVLLLNCWTDISMWEKGIPTQLAIGTIRVVKSFFPGSGQHTYSTYSKPIKHLQLHGQLDSHLLIIFESP